MRTHRVYKAWMMEGIHQPVAPDIALLAPVPLRHLRDGQSTCLATGKVAFGTEKFENTFLPLEAQRKGMLVDTYFYASHAEKLQLVVSWHGLYIGYVDAVPPGLHPAGMKYRPASTITDTRFGMFYEITDLRPLAEHEQLRLINLTGFRKKKAYGPTFIPEGPMLIKHP
jgi:hypothetical protein